MTCPTCARLGRVCLYCSTLCPCERDGGKKPCDCICHAADVEREGQVKAEKAERALREFEQARR